MQVNTLHDWRRADLPIPTSVALKASLIVPENGSASSYQSSAVAISSEAQNQIDATKTQLAWELSHPAPPVMEKLSQVNQKRSAKGLAPVDLPQTTRRLEEIYRDSSLSDKQKKEKVETIRKELGLSKGEMKSLFTKRMQAAYQKAEKRLAAFEKAKSEQFKYELKIAESAFGADSLQAKEIRDKSEALKAKLEPERQSLKAQGQFFGSLYPGFWSKLGNAFKKIGKVFSKVFGVLSKVLRFVPALGPLLSSGARALQSLLQGKFAQFGKSLLGVLGGAKNLLPMIPGIGPIASIAVSGIERLLISSEPTTRS